MKGGRVAVLVILGGAMAGGLVVQGGDQPAPDATTGVTPVVAGIAMPASAPPGSLSSTWYCAGGSATEGGVANHVVLMANPTDEDRSATVTAVAGDFAPPAVIPGNVTPGSAPTTTTTTTTTVPVTTTVPAPIVPAVVKLPPYSRVELPLSNLVKAPLAGAVVEVDGGQVVVEHEVTSATGDRAIAACSTTAATSWSFPWGVTARGARELLVFMNPFPGDASIDVAFATNEGARDTLRFRNFIVPGRSVVGAYVDDPGGAQRKDQVSAQVTVRSGSLVVDRIQFFGGDDDDDLEGITLGLGAPVPADTWMFPDGNIADGIREQIVVFNPSEDVAEVEVEFRLDDPQGNAPPEPYELTVLPGRFAIVSLPDPLAGPDDPPRVPLGAAHSAVVRSLNGVLIAAERVIVSSGGSPRGVGATLGSPLAAPTWYFAGGGIVAGEREEFITVFNASSEEIVTFSVTPFAGGRLFAPPGLQGLEIPPGGRVAVRLSEHTDLERLAVVVQADGPVVAERGLYRTNGRGLSQSMGVPLAVDVVVPEPFTGE